jgi:hypothetical protein
MDTTRKANIVQFPMLNRGAVLCGNKKGAEIPAELEMATMPPVATAVAVDPLTVAVRCWITC